MLFSYPSGRYILRKHYDDNLIKSALFSVSIFATIISIVLNLSPIFAKYIIIFFYLINLIILLTNSRIRRDLYREIVSIKLIIAVIFIIFIATNVIYNKIIIENSNLTYLFDSHDAFFIDPIAEILKAEYFSRIKIFSLYPKEWSSYHFFEAGFNSIFLAPVYQSGTIGLLILKNFYLSIFLTLFIFSFFKKKNEVSKKNSIYFFIKLFSIFLLLFLIFYPKIIYFILTKNFISTLSVIFIVQALFSKNKNDFLIWVIILSLSSFRNLIISGMLIIYYLIDTQYINKKIIFKRVKKIFNLPILFLTIIFLFYLASSFYHSHDISPKFNLPDNIFQWWAITTTNSVIANYKYFFIIFFFLILIFFIQTKFFLKEKKVFFKNFNRYDLYYFTSMLIIPIMCLILLIFKDYILSFYSNNKLLIFFNSFTLENIYYYFFPTIIWSFILLCCDIKIRIIFILTILFYVFLSIFIYNNIILPAIFTFEIMTLFFISHIFFNFKKIDNKKILSFLFIFSILLISIFNFKIYHSALFGHKNNPQISFKLNDLKNLKNKEFLCPNDVREISSHKDAGAALSGILFKPYYSDAQISQKYSNWGNIPLRYAVEASNDVISPCLNQ
jgi:hypothetical protein